MKMTLKELKSIVDVAYKQYWGNAVVNVRFHNEEQFDTGYTDTLGGIKIDPNLSSDKSVYLDIETIGY